MRKKVAIVTALTSRFIVAETVKGNLDRGDSRRNSKLVNLIYNDCKETADDLVMDDDQLQDDFF